MADAVGICESGLPKNPWRSSAESFVVSTDLEHSLYLGWVEHERAPRRKCGPQPILGDAVFRAVGESCADACAQRFARTARGAARAAAEAGFYRRGLGHGQRFG